MAMGGSPVSSHPNSHAGLLTPLTGTTREALGIPVPSQLQVCAAAPPGRTQATCRLGGGSRGSMAATLGRQQPLKASLQRVSSCGLTEKGIQEGDRERRVAGKCLSLSWTGVAGPAT